MKLLRGFTAMIVVFMAIQNGHATDNTSDANAMASGPTIQKEVTSQPMCNNDVCQQNSVAVATDIKRLLNERELSCVASYSVNTGNLIVPCVRESPEDLLSYSAIMQQQADEFTFVLSKMTSHFDSEETACDAIYDSTSQIVRIPCLSVLDNGIVTNPDALKAVYIRYDVDKNVFTLMSSREARESMTTANVPEREIRRWGYGVVQLPDTADVYSLMSRGGVPGTICRKSDISIRSGTVYASIYTVTGKLKYTGGEYAPKSYPYDIALYKSGWSGGWFDELIAYRQEMSYNVGNSTEFILGVNLPSANYYWCLTGFLYKATVKLSAEKPNP